MVNGTMNLFTHVAFQDFVNQKLELDHLAEHDKQHHKKCRLITFISVVPL